MEAAITEKTGFNVLIYSVVVEESPDSQENPGDDGGMDSESIKYPDEVLPTVLAGTFLALLLQIPACYIAYRCWFGVRKVSLEDPPEPPSFDAPEPPDENPPELPEVRLRVSEAQITQLPPNPIQPDHLVHLAASSAAPQLRDTGQAMEDLHPQIGASEDMQGANEKETSLSNANINHPR